MVYDAYSRKGAAVRCLSRLVGACVLVVLDSITVEVTVILRITRIANPIRVSVTLAGVVCIGAVIYGVPYPSLSASAARAGEEIRISPASKATIKAHTPRHMAWQSALVVLECCIDTPSEVARHGCYR